MHNENVHNFVPFTKHYCDNQIKENEIGGACRTHGRMKNACKFLVGKTEGLRSLGDLEVDGRLIYYRNRVGGCELDPFA